MERHRFTWRTKEPVKYTCPLCDNEDELRWYCNNCQKKLCDRCKEEHTRGKKTRNHDVVSIRAAKRQGVKPEPEVCKLHPGKLCDLFCADCDLLLCTVCLSKSHKHHNWKQNEEEISFKKQRLKRHIIRLSSKIQHVMSESVTRNQEIKTFKGNIDSMKKEVNSERTKLKMEVDSIADAMLAKLSTFENEESAVHESYCLRSEENIRELTRLLDKAEQSFTSSVDMFETEKLLNATLPLYDVTEMDTSPRLPSYATGSIDCHVLSNMMGELFFDNRRDLMGIDMKNVQHLSMFTITKQTEILSLCPVDNNHAWVATNQYMGLMLVDRKRVIKDTVRLDFCPQRIAMIGTTDILLTSYAGSTCVYKLSLVNEQVKTFADLRPTIAYDISINKKAEVFVSTKTERIVVLNQSGETLRTLRSGIKAWSIACLSSGDIALLDDYSTLVIVDSSGRTKFEWAGELDNGRMAVCMNLYQISRDKYDRLFVPDYNNNQVYVLPGDSTQAMCLLDKKHRVTNPIAVGMDDQGRVWIGCTNGVVHVVQL